MSKTTPEPKEFQAGSKEIHAVYKHNVDRFFDEVEKSIPQYHQSIENLQRSFLATWQKATESALSTNHEFVTKSGINSSVPAAMVKMANDTTEEIIKAQAIQNKVVLAAIDATHQAINAFNDNAKLFSWLDQSVLQYWIQACTPTRN